jgi:hypothetical protein
MLTRTLNSWIDCRAGLLVATISLLMPVCGPALRCAISKRRIYCGSAAIGGRLRKIIIHGHTPVPSAEIRINRLNIDTGAYATGLLTCLILERDKSWSVAA